jgi:hypothetical protein
MKLQQQKQEWAGREISYPKIEQKLYVVWDEDKKEWWIPPQQTIVDKRLNGFFIKKKDAEASIKFWERQATTKTKRYVNPYYPQHYTIVEFDIVESNK